WSAELSRTASLCGTLTGSSSPMSIMRVSRDGDLRPSYSAKTKLGGLQQILPSCRSYFYPRKRTFGTEIRRPTRRKITPVISQIGGLTFTGFGRGRGPQNGSEFTSQELPIPLTVSRHS